MKDQESFVKFKNSAENSDINFEVQNEKFWAIYDLEIFMVSIYKDEDEEEEEEKKPPKNKK